MSPGAIAFTAIIVSAAEWLAVIVALAALIYTKRILLAATPKPQAPTQPRPDAATAPADGDAKTGPVPLGRPA